MHVGLVLLARSTALNVPLHELCKTWLSEFCGDKLTSLEVSQVASSLVVMAVSKDEVAEESSGGI